MVKNGKKLYIPSKDLNVQNTSMRVLGLNRAYTEGFVLKGGNWNEKAGLQIQIT